jgi:hypothetical protein
LSYVVYNIGLLLFSFILATLSFVATYSVRRISRLWLLAILLVSFVLSVSLILLNINTFPYSDILVFVFATFAGSLLGRVLFSSLCSWLPQSSISSHLRLVHRTVDRQHQVVNPLSAVMDYVNFTVPLGSNHHFRIGVFNLLLISAVVMYFATNGVQTFPCLLFRS